jgi:UDP-N-acetyl-D-glucosamine dehydrogenase
MSILAPLTPSAIAAQRLERFKSRTASIGVIGLGCVGLPLCLLLSDAGFKVTGFDIDEKKVDDLEAGRSYIFRISKEEIQVARRRGFRSTQNFSFLAEQDAIILCVP